MTTTGKKTLKVTYEYNGERRLTIFRSQLLIPHIKKIKGPDGKEKLL